MANDYTKYPTVVYEEYKTAGTPMPNPSRPLSEGLKVSTIVSEFDSGHTQRRNKSNPKRTFQLTYTVLTLDQYKTIRAFFMKKLNTYEFNWVHPVEGTVLNVRFTNDTLSAENFSHGVSGPLYKLQLSLEQVW
jgi:phage-related protein